MLEGLRRLDEGITPSEAFPEGYTADAGDIPVVSKSVEVESVHQTHVPAFLSFMGSESSKRKPLFAGAVVVALLASVAVIGVPAGWYSRAKVAAVAAPAETPAQAEVTAPTATPEAVTSESPENNSEAEDAAALAARRQRERIEQKRKRNKR